MKFEKKLKNVYTLYYLLTLHRHLDGDPAKIKKDQNKDVVSTVIKKAEKSGDVSIVIEKIDGMNMNDLRDASDKIKDNIENVVVFLVGVQSGKGFMICSAR